MNESRLLTINAGPLTQPSSTRSAARFGPSPSQVITPQGATKERQSQSTANCSASREVDVSASVGDPDVDAELLYGRAVSAGHIRGQGPKVIWDLSDVADGKLHRANDVVDGLLVSWMS